MLINKYLFLSYVFCTGHYSWNFTRISLNRKEIQRVVLIPLMHKISFGAYLHIPVSKAEEGNYESYNLQGVYLCTLSFCCCWDRGIFASQGLRFGSPFSPPLADLEYILRIRALIFHWLRLPVHVSNQKTFYTDHVLSTKCKQRWHQNPLI